MSRKRRDLTPEERTLWRRVARGVKTRRPLLEADELAPDAAPRTAPRATVAPPRPAPPPRQERSASLADRGAEKKVRRGAVEIGASLDLHGHTQESGRAALARFLRAAHKRGDRVVLVVTGQGRGGEGVLKRAFPDWLHAHDLKPLLAGYSQAHRSHGGAGAFYVFLKRAT